jgi:hypothetical protein
VTDFTTRAIACGAALLAFHGGAAQAQEVQVFSQGKPFAISDDINASFAPARDERKARRPLDERHDAGAIAGAYAAAFLRCGLGESPPQGGQHEGATGLKEASFVPIAGTRKIILLGEFARGKAIIDLDKHTVLTPQCPAGVRGVYWSYSADRVAFAAQAVTGIAYYGANRALWTAKFKDAQDVYYFDSKHASGGFRKLVSLPNEKVLDVLLPDNTDQLWVLSQSDSVELRKGAAATPANRMDFYLRKIDLKGNVLETVEVARAVPDGSAQFARE